ncbi:UbiA family prenyltransferase [Streptomyces sp. NPDC002795]|uniref:UbiA family prenyltransferase n=1 Tax=Streptomyces sp. NPDC002795 TaxID=3364665 RepID=UPI003689FD2E
MSGSAAAGVGVPGGRGRAWVELLRLPALFTVPGDALAGAAAMGSRPTRGTLLAVGASVSLYAAGMALNDWADRDEDARDRPHRPLPSGRIRPTHALAAAGALTGTGLALACRAGRTTGAVATALAATVWAYDLHLKGTAAGPAAMGAARALDLLMGATATAPAGTRGVPGRAAHAATARAGAGGGVESMRVGAAGRAGVSGIGGLLPVAAAAVAGARGVLGRAVPVAAVRAGAGGGVESMRVGATGRAGVSGIAGLLPAAAAAVAGARGVLGRAVPVATVRAGAGGGVESMRVGVTDRAGASGIAGLLPVAAAAVAGARGVPGRAAPAATVRVGAGGGVESMRVGAAGRAGVSGIAGLLPAAAAVRAGVSGIGGLLPVVAAARAGARGGLSAARAGVTTSAGTLRPLAPALTAAATLAVHTTAVTTVSRTEAQGGSSVGPLKALAVGGAIAATLLTARAGRPLPEEALLASPTRSGRGRPTSPAPITVAVPAAVYAVTALRPLLHAALNPSPPLTQRAVGAGIRALVPLQSALCARSGAPVTALATLVLAPLARRFAKKVSVT